MTKTVLCSAALMFSSILLTSAVSWADVGVVVADDVCGMGNSIIETSDGWYIAAEHYGGVYLYEGDQVAGNMRTYGMEDIVRVSDGNSGSFYIEDFETTLGKAYEELCK